MWTRGELTFGALFVVVACGGTAVVDGDNGFGGDSNTTTTPRPSGGNGGTGGSGASGGTGPGPTSGVGGGPCLSCLNWVEIQLQGNEAPGLEAMCGYVPGTGSCAPNSSCARLDALFVCVCVSCDGVCPQSCSGMGTDAPECDDCLTNSAMSACAPEFNACTADI